MTEKSFGNSTNKDDGGKQAKEYEEDWLRVRDLRECLSADQFEKDEIYDYAVMLLEWAIAKRAISPREAMNSLLAPKGVEAAEQMGLFHRIAQFFQNWSGDDDAGETIPIAARDMRLICGYRQDAFWLRRQYDSLLNSLRPSLIHEDDLARGEYPVVWLEDIDKNEVIPALWKVKIMGRYGFITLNGEIYPLIAGYGKRWRAWTNEPTKEQRRVTPWKQE